MTFLTGYLRWLNLRCSSGLRVSGGSVKKTKVLSCQSVGNNEHEINGNVFLYYQEPEEGEAG